jgi:ATP-binding cassette subfamily C protein
MSLLGALSWLFRILPRRQGAALLLLMTLASLTEGFGLLLLVPLLTWLGREHGGAGTSASWLRGLTSLGWMPGAGLLLGAFVALVALRGVIQYGRDQMSVRLQLTVVDALRLACFETLLRSEWRWMATTRRADHANVLLSEVSRVGVGLNFGLLLLASTATLLTYLSAAMLLSWRLTLVALASGGLMFRLLSGQRRNALNLGQDLTHTGRALHGLVQESLAGTKLAKIHGAEARQIASFACAASEVRQRQLQFSAGNSKSQALFQVAGAALLAGYLYLGLQLWHTPLPVLLTLVVMFSRLVPLLMAAQQQIHHLLHALPAGREIDRLLAEGRQQAEPPAPGQRASWPVREAIRLESVSIIHAGREHPALDGLSLGLPAGLVTLVMGPSGAGKSTLADVLMGLLEPDAGRLTVDGAVVAGADRLLWRANVAYVPQEVLLFHDSIRRNLLWACPGASDAALHRALERASAHFVAALPQGLDTVVGEGGVRLSGGERQRLALARALLREPSLLILDEATSALDVDNEARILHALERLRGELTVLIIGHRPSLVRHADQVLVLEDGRLQSASRGAAATRGTSTSP